MFNTFPYASQMLKGDIFDDVERAIGRRPLDARPLGGGCVGDVRLLVMPGAERLVAKVDRSGGPSLAAEAATLRYLAERTELPVPRVVHGDGSLLVMEYIEAGDPIDEAAERHAAELLAALHGVTAPSFGFEMATPIGGLLQPNPRTTSWVEFFRDHRLLAMGREATCAGRLPERLLGRLEALCGRLDGLIEPQEAPALVHGDVWSGNVLVRRGRVAAFIDPALSFSHLEVELAFITLFGTFGEAFFERYRRLRPIAEGFFERRRDVYNLYPLLVHVRLFGGDYVRAVATTLDRLGEPR